MKLALIDDSAADRMRLREYLDRLFSEEYTALSPCVNEFASGEEFLKAYERGEYDVLFIDMLMGGMSGVDLAKRIRESGDGAIIVFSTSSPDFAIEGYSVRASGYLLKPYSFDKFRETFAMLDSSFLRCNEYIELAVKRSYERVLLDSICYVSIDGHYTCVHTVDGDVIRSRLAFRDAAEILLKHSRFMLCYQGCVINMDKVQKVNELDFVMEDGACIPMRKREYAELRRRYADYLFARTRGEVL